MTPGRRSTPEDTSTAAAPVAQIAAATFSAVSPPANPRRRRPPSLQHQPIESSGIPPGPRRLRRRLRLQHQPLGTAGLHRQISLGLDPQRVPDRQPEPRLQFRNPLRPGINLQGVEPHYSQHGLHQRIRRIDEQPDPTRPARDPRRQGRGSLRRDVSRRGRVEDGAPSRPPPPRRNRMPPDR